MIKKKDYENANLDEFDMNDVYDFLFGLRKSGVVNMYGAGPWLYCEYGMDSKQAAKTLAQWMQYCKEHTTGKLQ